MNTSPDLEKASSYRRATRKAGTRALVTMAILLAVLIVLNLAVSLIPSRMTRFDTTDDGRYTLSATTEQFLSNLQEDVTVYVVCKDGYLELDKTYFDILADKEVSGKIEVKPYDAIFLKEI